MEAIAKFIEGAFGVLMTLVLIVITLLSIFVSLFGLAEISWWIISGEFFHFIQPIAATF